MDAHESITRRGVSRKALAGALALTGVGAAGAKAATGSSTTTINGQISALQADDTAAKAAIAALQTDVATLKTAVAALQARAPAPTPAPTPTPTGTKRFSVRGCWDFNPGGTTGADWALQTSLGLNLILADLDTNFLTQLAKTGYSAWLQVDPWNNTTGAPSYPNSVADQWLAEAVATGAISGIYIADEPSGPGNIPAAIKAQNDHYKSLYPHIETIVTLWDYTTIPAFAHTTDAVVLDGYPLSGTAANPRYDATYIPNAAAAADKAGWKYYGTLQAFGDGTTQFLFPTAAQFQTMVNAWLATNMAGFMVYTFGTQSSNPKDALDYKDASGNYIHQDIMNIIKSIPA